MVQRYPAARLHIQLYGVPQLPNDSLSCSLFCMAQCSSLVPSISSSMPVTRLGIQRPAEMDKYLCCRSGHPRVTHDFYVCENVRDTCICVKHAQACVHRHIICTYIHTSICRKDNTALGDPRITALVTYPRHCSNIQSNSNDNTTNGSSNGNTGSRPGHCRPATPRAVPHRTGRCHSSPLGCRKLMGASKRKQCMFCQSTCRLIPAPGTE